MRHGSLSDSIRAFLFSRSEGVRVRETYQRLSREAGVEWHGRRYERDAWAAADPVNRALSAANSALYAILHAAIVQLGYSPALGFVHTGTHSSFIYDVADLYKTRTALPAAFTAAREPGEDIEATARSHLRERLSAERVMRNLAHDLDHLLQDNEGEEGDKGRQVLWSPDGGDAAAGTNYGSPRRLVVKGRPVQAALGARLRGVRRLRNLAQVAHSLIDAPPPSAQAAG